MSRILRAAGALAAVISLTLTTLVAPAGAAPRADDSGAQAGTRWLAKELSGGLLHNTAYDFDDLGLSVDAALAASSVEGGSSVAARVTTAVSARLDEYVGTGTETYAGATAKVLVLAQSTGRDPRSFGGRDLVATLEGQVTATGPNAGRLFDTSEYGDYANTISQAYAALGLARAGSPQAGVVKEYLLRQQCTDGYFRLYFAPADAAAQGCVPGVEGSAPDTDVTSIAVANVVQDASTDKAGFDAVQRAVTWLRSQQRKNGSFGGGTSTSKPNANSTALAATALGMTERFGPAHKGAAWLRTLQPADVGPCRSELTKEKGAIAYDKKALKAGRKDGLTGDAEDQWRRTTTQVVPALRYARDGAGKVRLKVPAQARPGTRVRVRVLGLAHGEQACVWVKGQAKRVTGKPGKVTTVKLRLPKAARPTVVTVRTLDAKARARVKVRR